MENVKFYEIKWRSAFCQKDLVIVFSNMHEFVGALRAIIEDNSQELLDVTTFERHEH